MTLIELFAPKGSLSEEMRTRLAHRLVTELISGEGVPADAIERGRAQTWCVVHEPAAWTVAGRPVATHEPPRYLVRVSLPAGHMNDGMRAELVRRVTRVLAETAAQPQRLYEQPDAWVQIIEVADGSIGVFGQVVPTAEIIRMVVDAEHRERVIGRRAADPVQPGNGTHPAVVDPICGMTVVLTEDALTLEIDGVTYGFCSESCRELFRGQRAGAAE